MSKNYSTHKTHKTQEAELEKKALKAVYIYTGIVFGIAAVLVVFGVIPLD